MNHDIKMLLHFYRELVKAEYEGCASYSERMSIADRAEIHIAKLESGESK